MDCNFCKSKQLQAVSNVSLSQLLTYESDCEQVCGQVISFQVGHLLLTFVIP